MSEFYDVMWLVMWFSPQSQDSYEDGVYSSDGWFSHDKDQVVLSALLGIMPKSDDIRRWGEGLYGGGWEIKYIVF